MSIDEQLRDTLTQRAATYDISVSPPETIAKTATRRSWRNKGLSTVGVISLLAATVLTIGNGGTEDTSESIFAGLASESSIAPEPSTIIPVEDGFVGVAMVQDEPVSFSYASQIGTAVFATSPDGSEWTSVDGDGLVSRAVVKLDEHDGLYYAVGTRDDEDGNTYAYVARSKDLNQWEEFPLEPDATLAPSLDGWRFDISPKEIVANDGGIFVQLDRFGLPDLDSIDLPDGEPCRMIITGQSVQFRICGTNEVVTATLDNEVSAFSLQDPFEPEPSLHHSALSDALSFSQVELPAATRYVRSTHIYPTDSGIGTTGRIFAETTDGISWTQGYEPNTDSSLVAARGSERLQVSGGVPHARYSPDWSPNDENWVRVDLETVPSATPPPKPSASGVTFSLPTTTTAAVAGEAGWVIVTSENHLPTEMSMPVRPEDAQVESFDFAFAPKPSPILIAIGDYAFDGTFPWGPATLLDADGVAVLSWEGFEAESPWTNNSSVDLSDRNELEFSLNGEVIAATPLGEWMTALPSGDPFGQVSTVHFSANGTDFVVLDSFDGMAWDIAVGDDEVVVGAMDGRMVTTKRYEVNPSRE